MRLLFALVFLFSGHILNAQEESYADLVKAEERLSAMFDQLYNLEDSANKLELFRSVDSLMFIALELPGSFNYAWDRLDKIGKMSSDDKVLKVFSLVYMESRNSYHYSAFFQIMEKRGRSSVFHLKPGTSDKIKTENYPQKLDDWHGKIYYELVTKEFKRRTFYTLLGTDYNNIRTSIKTVEVITIQRDKPVFRGAQFLDGGTVRDRKVFEFSADIFMSVRYNKELEMIVFDHIVPLHPLYHGIYQFYGPDGSYDGMKFVDGIWVLEEDVDARNK